LRQLIPWIDNLTCVPQTEERNHDRRRPVRVIGGTLVRVAVKVAPGAARKAVRAVAKVDPEAVRTAAAALPPPGPPTGRPPEGGCLVCHSSRVSRRDVEYFDNPALRKTVNLCARCGYLAIDEVGPSHYREATSLKQLPSCQRIGSTERPGREFQMARMALQILGRKGPQDVLVYGAGRSLDNLHIQRLRRAGTVAIADIMKVRDDAPFVDVNNPGKQRFPVIVASEVLEHFRDPWSDFATMLGMVDPRGLVVCGTNIHDGRPNLERDRYIYYRDHTSYYSVQSIRRIATAMGFHVDFRHPVGLGRRKRYVLFTPSTAVLERTADYFGKVPSAPSEVTFNRRQERLAQSAG
jgi:hypothetical protein